MLKIFTEATMQSRLIIGFGAVLTMMIVITVVGINNVNTIDKTMTIITDKNSVKQRYAINFRGSVHDRAIAIRDTVLVTEQYDLQSTLNEIERLESFYNDSRFPLDELMLSDSMAKENNILDKIKAVESKTMPLVEQVIIAVKEGDKNSADELLLTAVRPAFVEWLAAINEFIDYQEVENQKATKVVRDSADSFQGIMVILTSIAFMISAFIVYLMVRSLKESLDGEPSEVAALLAKVADGDLTQHMSPKYDNSVLASLNRTQQKLNTTVTNIADASRDINSQIDTVSHGSSEVLALVQQQSAYTLQASNNLDDMREKTYTVSELLVQTEENSSHTLASCTSGSNSVNETANEIRKVLDTVSVAVEKLQKLEQRTKDISGIISVISGISDQTNLLALNAAIEAARAGESGRGFAVVADEVRTLAQSTGSATSEIESMLTEILKETGDSVSAMESTLPKIEKGLSLGVNSAELLKEIETQANDSLANVRKVVDASKEQIVVIDELYDGMKSVAEMADSSTASLEKNNQVANSLDVLATHLKEQIAYFKVKV